jgi:hypothetical protein
MDPPPPPSIPPPCIRPRGEDVAILFSCCRKFEFLCWGDVDIFSLFLLGACEIACCGSIMIFFRIRIGNLLFSWFRIRTRILFRILHTLFHKFDLFIPAFKRVRLLIMTRYHNLFRGIFF